MVDKPNYKKDLTPEQYEVCWNNSTESPFSGKYHDCKTTFGNRAKCVCLSLPPPPPLCRRLESGIITVIKNSLIEIQSTIHYY